MNPDSKVTLSFDSQVIESAKQYAESKGISLSRLTEILLRRLLTGSYATLEDYPVANWVNEVAEGEAKYIKNPKPSSGLRSEMRKSRTK